MARDWPYLPQFQSEEDAAAASPDGWTTRQIEDIFDKLEIGKRFDQKTSFASGNVPVIDQSADGFVGYHDEQPGVVASITSPVITFANHTCEMRVMRRPFSVIQNVFPMVGRLGVCETLFFYYATKGRVHLEEYKGHYPDFRRLWINLPPLAEQKAIAAVLGALDDKIELNRRMNATLEAMARTLFQSWFVDFDPVRRNLDRAGNKSTDLSSKTMAEEDALFPGSFEDSSLGLIPKGWRRATLGDPELFPLVAPGGLPDSGACMQYIATGDVSLDYISSEVQGELKTLPSRANMRPGLGRIWFAKMKDSPKFLWTMAEDDRWWSTRVLSTGFAGIQAISPDYEALLYCFVMSPKFEEAKNGFANGTTMQSVNNETIARIDLVVPPPALARRFSDIVRPLFRRRWSNYREARSLATLRDTLLPKLVSGKLSVKKSK